MVTFPPSTECWGVSKKYGYKKEAKPGSGKTGVCKNNVVALGRRVAENKNERVVIPIPFFARAFQCWGEDGRAPIGTNKKQRFVCRREHPPGASMI